MKSLFEKLKEYVFKNIDPDPHGNFFNGATPEPHPETEEFDFSIDDED